MPLPEDAEQIAEAIRKDVSSSRSARKRLKVRSLLRKFGYAKRSDSNTAEITQLLSGRGISINPPIVRLGNDWELSKEDWVYLSTDQQNASPRPVNGGSATAPPSDWNGDEWFDRVADKALRTEKEVEIKFIVPLLTRLGYSEDDRYDGMPVPAAHGSRSTTLVIDFALFNSDLEVLRNQPLLTVEAKREQRLAKAKELLSAHNQAKSYSLWTQCDFFLVTDSRTIQVFHVARGGLDGPSPLFSCSRQQLKSRFGELYQLISKNALTRHYLAKLGATEEAS
ncbi:MAG: type I restriction enzyme HsdR N-terminal domain-containing protein [Longimicrobiaceae bacterium]|jgi:hypothetical protein